MSFGPSTRRIRKCWISAPATNRTGIDMNSESRGSMPKVLNRKNVMYIPIITNSPWAKLTILTTPKISVTPIETSA